jgi:hypothetical protein
MLSSFVRDARLLVCLAALFCASCLAMTAPKGGGAEPGMGSASTDKRLMDTWELLYRVNDTGEKAPPNEGTRTLIEFTDKGRVIFNRVDKDHSDMVANRTGKYAQQNNEIVITDDKGNTVKWTYVINDDSLIVNAPELKQTFHWRRFR